MRLLLSALISCAATTAAADITISYRDGAPMDRFTITNTGTCDLGRFDLTVDLAGSPSNLIFDTTDQGLGVEVSQPFEIVSGIDNVIAADEILDGDTRMSMTLSKLPAGGVVAFTIDIDDTVGTREITVSGAEIAGATMSVNSGGQVSQGTFDAQGEATAETVACGS